MMYGIEARSPYLDQDLYRYIVPMRDAIVSRIHSGSLEVTSVLVARFIAIAGVEHSVGAR